MSVSLGKAKKVLSKSFLENNANISVDQAADMVVRSELKIRDLTEERNNDENLTAAKQVVKDLSAGYNSAIQYEQAKISFLLEKIASIESGEVNPDSAVNQP